MAARSPQALSPVSWLPKPAATDAALASWLLETGLLTQRLRTLCAADFHLDVLAEQAAAGAQPMRREVLLCCDAAPCIYALTEVPPLTVHNHPWLQALGAASLGEALRTQAQHSNTELSRSTFTFALLDVAQLPAAVQQCQNTPAWARRSEFRLDEDHLTVTEIFLSGLLNCEQQNLRASGG